ncbi:ComF family protein [Pumilibacter intestinalis]|jgi:competence protein ComFC|uniref:ComF family protein n=1 Tax=Pumilibacter intestinalis TaxID=2941511 RepID=UPI00203BA84E|nr:ComF family protein [Pumilibacter intestinalis]
MGSLTELIKEIIYPSGIKCIVCGCELDKTVRNCVCDKCKLPLITEYCTVCGRAVPPQNAVCDNCKQREYPFSAARSSFEYNGGAAKLVHRLKYRDARYLAPYMAEYMADTYYSANWKPDIITSVPVHKSRRRTRGYNQSELLACELAKRIGIESEVLLAKTVKTKDLVGQSRAEREETVKDSFALSEKADVKAKSVLLIDDVFTTGSTAAECSRVLIKNGAAEVFVLTFASVK